MLRNKLPRFLIIRMSIVKTVRNILSRDGVLLNKRKEKTNILTEISSTSERLLEIKENVSHVLGNTSSSCGGIESMWKKNAP